MSALMLRAFLRADARVVGRLRIVSRSFASNARVSPLAYAKKEPHVGVPPPPPESELPPVWRELDYGRGLGRAALVGAVAALIYAFWPWALPWDAAANVLAVTPAPTEAAAPPAEPPAAAPPVVTSSSPTR